jgi:hypothetical protein
MESVFYRNRLKEEAFVCAILVKFPKFTSNCKPLRNTELTSRLTQVKVAQICRKILRFYLNSAGIWNLTIIFPPWCNSP